MENKSLHPRITDSRELADDSGRENLALIASHFICHRLGVGYPPHDQIRREAPPQDLRVCKLKNFVLHILRSTQLVDDVLFGALMIIERMHNLRPYFFSVHPLDVIYIGKLLFIPAYIIAADSMAGVTISRTPFNNIVLNGHWIDSRTKIWTSARNFEKDPIIEATNSQKHEGWVLSILNDDISLDEKMLARFKKNVTKDFGNGQGPFPYYPRTFVTNRPVFLHQRV